MPTLKTAEKQLEEQPKHPKNSQNSCFSGVSAFLPAVFRLFSMLGIWHLCRWPRRLQRNSQDDGKGGLGFRGVAFMTVWAGLTVLAVLENTLPSFCLSETTMTVLTVSAVVAVVAVSVVTATPP